MQWDTWRAVLDRQDHVIARRQLVDGGATDNDIRRWRRQHRLVPVHPGVYVTHRGPRTWRAEAWAAVLYSWPAALCDRSAIDLAGSPIHVAIDAARRGVVLPGVRLHRLDGLADRVLWNLSPPRLRLEDALLAECNRLVSRDAVLARIADLCRQRRTTVDRLLPHVLARHNLRHRALLLDVLDEVEGGVHSLLESGFVRHVERAHGLPRSRGQRTDLTVDGTVHRDRVVDDLATAVELDGRLGHEDWSDRADDMDRDLLAAGDGLMTLRLGWRHCYETPCRTAVRLAAVYQARGWQGQPRGCGPGCPVTGRFPVAS